MLWVKIELLILANLIVIPPILWILQTFHRR